MDKNDNNLILLLRDGGIWVCIFACVVVPLTAVMDRIAVVVVCMALFPSAVVGVKEHLSY